MAYKYQKNAITGEPEIVIDGFEYGIAASPHKGIANMQGVNIATESGEAMASFARTQESQVCGTGTLTQANATTDTVILLTSTGLHNWTVPSDWSNANTIEVIGGGGGPGDSSGGANVGPRLGGGGGAYSKITNLYGLSAGDSVPYSVGAAGTEGVDGGDTWFGASTYGASHVAAKGGKAATVTGGVNNGGSSASGIGDVKYSGGRGGQRTGGNTFSGTGGGGAAGPNGNGVNGVDINGAAPGTPATNGGAGDNSSGGAGGTAPAGNGADGSEWGSNKGSGGAGSGGNESGGSGNGGNGGLYGAGAGSKGLAGTQGTAAQGAIRITYRPVEQPMTVGGIDLKVGSWINITNAGTTGLSTGNYYYVDTGRISRTFSQDDTTFVGGINNGTATFTVYCMGKPIMSAYENYTSDDNTSEYRYYILDDLAQIWIHDTATLSTVTTPDWYMGYVPAALNGREASGLAVLNGWLTYTVGTSIYWSPTVFPGFGGIALGSQQLGSEEIHATLVGHQGKLYWTDNSYIASMFPNGSSLSGGPNLQSYCKYTAVTTTATVETLIGGSYPNLSSLSLRTPVIFFTMGTLPSSLTADFTSFGLAVSQLYWIEWASSGTDFSVYAASSGGAALDMQTGAVGDQYFNTFCPVSLNSTSKQNFTFTAQRVNLPFFETAQCMAELGNTVVIGGVTNTLYPWDQVNALPNTVIQLPESNTTQLVTANSALYAFTGQKGNIYVTNGSSASYALSIPSYCAGIAGTPNTYIDPYFTWAGAAFIRGRVYCSIQDQTASKAGNCGGIWSFIPTQSGGAATEYGMALRLENQNSYGTYNGATSVILPSQDQSAMAPQYWSGWYSNISNPLYGIDFSSTTPITQFVIETDLIPTGDALNKKTWKQLEYKLSTNLVAGDSVAFYYRQNSTDAYVSCGTMIVESTTDLSGYLPVNFEKGQWLQLKVVATPLNSTSSSFIRLKQLTIR